jgi:hypothetical protein
MITGPPHDPHFHCAFFGLLIAVGSFALGQSKIWRKMIKEILQDEKSRSDASYRNV